MTLVFKTVWIILQKVCYQSYYAYIIIYYIVNVKIQNSNNTDLFQYLQSKYNRKPILNNTNPIINKS